jgi:transmembrane sensor
MDTNERRARATHEATQWWNRLTIERSSKVTKADRELFTQWLRESPLHVAELLRIAQVHDALERFKLWSEVEVGDAHESHNVIPLREAESAEVSSGASLSSAERTSADGRQTYRSRVSSWAIAASICLVAVTAGWFALGTRGQVIETELAERRQVMLDDGSVVQLEPETKLRVKFEDHNRYVALERGRALFRVAKDAQRPFWVSTDHTSVRAVGTAFGVENGKRGVIVTVAEGKVAVGRSRGKLPWSALAQEKTHIDSQGAAPGEGPVIPTDGPASHSTGSADKQGISVQGGGRASGEAAAASAPEIFLTAGQQLTVQTSGAVDRVRTVDTARALAWAQGQLVFENDTLADVVAEFNRYNRTQLHINDLQLATRRVSGVFEATDMETLLAFIRQGGGEIRITQTDRGVVIDSSSRSAAHADVAVQ